MASERTKRDTDLARLEGEPSAGSTEAYARQKADITVATKGVKVGLQSSGPADSPINMAIAETIAVGPAAGLSLLLDHFHAATWVSSVTAVGVWLVGSAAIVWAWTRARAGRH